MNSGWSPVISILFISERVKTSVDDFAGVGLIMPYTVAVVSTRFLSSASWISFSSFLRSSASLVRAAFSRSLGYEMFANCR